MTEIDFITALGRLLRDGHLRDAFAANPQAVATQINLSRNEWPAFLPLVPEDLEFQARILLRKRLELVRQLLPETFRLLGENAWAFFLEYSRGNWPSDLRAAMQDAFQFCRWLKQQHPRFVSRSELNRLQFALSDKHLAIRCLFQETIHEKTHPMMQIFFRGSSKKWRELSFYLGF